MKKALPGFIALAFSLCVYGQEQMNVKKANFTSFRSDKKLVTEVLASNSSEAAKQHPEYGILPFNAQCSECVELIDKRTLDTRLFVDPKRVGHTYSQQSYFPLHYKKSENDIWRTIDFRLRPDANTPNVYVANNQPAPTKCDLNKKTTSVNQGDFEFEFNKNLSLYFFDENTVYTQKEAGNYTDYTIGEEGLRVKNMWNGIDMQQQFRAGEIKTSYTINAPLQMPLSKGYMVIEDHFTLPPDYSFEESSNGFHLENNYFRGDYEVKNAKGDVLLKYEKPIYYDARVWGMFGIYKLLRSGNDYTLQTLVPVEWLNKADNIYPLTIDPTLRSGVTLIGNFRLAGTSANLGFTTMSLGSCDHNLPAVIVPGKTTLLNTYIDLEYQLTYDNMCGTPPLPPPFCTFSQVTMEVRSDACNTTTGLLACNPANPPYTGTCTTDPNLVAGAQPVTMGPSYLACIPPQCPDYALHFTLKNRDSICGDVCGYLCARGNMWQMTVEACLVDGNITQDKNQVCAGQPVVFTAHPNCGVPPYHFAWTKDGGNTFDTIYGSPTFTIYPQQNTIVSCIIYDTCNGFAATNDLSVSVTASPTADAGPDAHLCAGGAVNLGGPGTTAGASITWSAETTAMRNWLNSTTIPSPVAAVPNGTVDTFFYVISASNGACARTDTAYVFSNPSPTADAGADVTICAGGTVTLGGSPTSNISTIQWTGENANVSSWLLNPTAANPQAIVPAGTTGSFRFIVIATAPTCFKTDTVTVISNSPPLADAGVDKHVCEGGVATLGGNPTSNGGNVLWSGQDALTESWLSSATAANPQATIPQGTIDSFLYVVRVDDPLCPQTDTVKVVSHLNPSPIIDSSGSTRICANATVRIATVGSFSAYQWNNGSTSAAINANQAGPYFVTVTDAFGCTGTSNIITVTTIPVPTVQVFPDTLITYGDSVTLYTDLNLSSASVDSFTWYPTVNISCTNCNNPVVSPQEAAQYYGINIYANGCTATDSALIRVIFPNNFFIPNAFTPNGDGNNDNFYIQAQSGVKVLLFQVFNRWGEKIHEGSYPWDGYYRGKQAMAGVYIYVFKLGLFGDEQSIFRKGSVTLIR
jgi:gliding motility-associated-like protein